MGFSSFFGFREACCLLLVTHRGAHCAPDRGVSTEGGNVCARASRGNAACAAASRTRGGGTGWFPLPLANHHPFL